MTSPMVQCFEKEVKKLKGYCLNDELRRPKLSQVIFILTTDIMNIYIYIYYPQSLFILAMIMNVPAAVCYGQDNKCGWIQLMFAVTVTCIVIINIFWRGTLDAA